MAKALFKPILAAFGHTSRKEPAKRPVPAAPIGLEASEVSADAIALNWEPSANATFYTVYIGETASTTEMRPVGNPTSSRFTVDGLEEGKQYFFAVKAINSTGASPFSNVTNRRTL
ncbi:fibronectin type III domain-containing protein [Candidatus Sumerlaeota bacterium]|nr:fibronectin type III domain-containing protein [Candidatus Sumerlaeota bacterium]